MANSGIFPRNTPIWANKYRPKDLSEYIADADFKEKINAFLTEGTVKDLLFEGPPGTGKSTIANLIVSGLDCDYLYINGSDERGIDTVRIKLKNFAATTSFAPLKIIFIDEFSEFTSEAQDSLRALMELFNANTRFILTCNNVENIIDAIRSRCQEYTVIPPSKEKVKHRCFSILKSESVSYEEEDVENIIEHLYPDVRKIINTLDQNTIGKELKLTKEFFKLLLYKTRVVEILKSVKESNLFTKVTEIRQLLADTRVKKFNDLYRFLYDNIHEYEKKEENMIPIILTLAKGQVNDAQVVDKEINVVSTLLEITDIIK